MRKLISGILLTAMLLSMLGSCGITLPQKAELDLDAYPQEAAAQNVDYTAQTAWDGTSSDTSWYSDSATSFTLSDGADLKGFIDLIYSSSKTFEGKTVTLKNDINLGGKAWSIPTSSNYFKGTFDGAGYTIGGFTITTDQSNQSLLGAIGGAATVKNLTVLGGTITMQNTTSRKNVSSVISRVVGESGKTVNVTNVTSGCTIKQKSDTSTANYIGGIIGLIEGSGSAVKITGCTFNGSVNTISMREVGGIVGSATGSATLTFTNCTNNGTLVRGREYVGGILGAATNLNASLTFKNCDNNGKVELYHEYAGGNAGGIVGRAIIGISESVNRDLTYTVTFTDCDNTGTVGALGHSNFKYQTEINGGSWVGGIAGYIYGATTGSYNRYIKSVTFTNCTNTGTMKANRTSGGIAGFVQRSQLVSFSNCTVDADLTFVINDTGTYNHYDGGLFGAVHTKSATYNSGAAIVVSDCVVAGTMHIYEPYNSYSKIGGLAGLVRQGQIKMTNCQVNTKMSIEHLEMDTTDTTDLDEINLTVAGFENNATYYGGESAQSVTYFYHNEIPTVESYATANNTQAYFKPIGHQYRYNSASNTYDLRYVFGVNNLAETDKGIGFTVERKTLGDTLSIKETTVFCSMIYNTINADGASYKASDFNCQYLCTLVISGVPADQIWLTDVNGVEAAYAIDTVLEIAPITQASAEAAPLACAGALRHAYNPQQYTFKQEAFTPYLPTVFAQEAEQVIAHNNLSFSGLKGTRGCVTYKKKSSAFLLQDICACGGETCAWNAHGVAAYRSATGMPFCYYIDETTYNSVFTTAKLTDRYEAYYSFDFEVAEDGYYDFCFEIYLPGDAGSEQEAYALVQFDDEAYHEQSELYYSVVVRDGVMRDSATNGDSYLTGYNKYLTKGTHTITFRQPYDGADGTSKVEPFRIREVYYYKDAVEPVDANIPLPSGATLYDGNFANNVTYVLDGTTKTVFTSYVNTLKSNGFTQKDYRTTTFQYSDFDVTNTPSDGNYTYTGNYVDNRNYYNYYYILTNADYMINVYFCSATGDMRVVVSDIEDYERYKAVNDAATAPYTAITTPLFAQLDIGGPNFTLATGPNAGSNITGVTNGLCLVYRLSDGRFMVVDGGYWNDKDTEGEEMARLFKWMQEHADYDNDGIYTNNKVTIAAWMITHHHSDHINGAYKFGMMYKDNELVEIQNYLYNFPSYEYASSNYGTDLAIGGAYTTYYPKMYTLFGHYDSQIVHSGMVYKFGDATIEILATHEDFYPDRLNIYNNSSTTFKITLAGKTFLVAGDLQEEGQIKAIKRCGTLLESDFLQVTHHGCNGQIEFFKYIVGKDASGNFNTDTIIVWPLPKGENMSWFNGNSARAVAMRWLRDMFRNSSDLANDNIYYASENWEFTDFPKTTIPTFTDADFSATKPSALTGSNVIKVLGENCETGCTTIISDTQLYTNGIVTGASANGAHKLLTGGDYHYYIDQNMTGYGEAGLQSLSLKNCYIRFSFEVTTAGTYQLYTYNRVKAADTRRGVIRFDDQTPMAVTYKVTDLAAVRDTTEGSYLKWDGVSVYLEKGTHTFTYTTETGSSFHFRDLYLVKQ